jgi:2-polyprenyl-3-methyl-5-hydroxy-6-metoxy-1,4-benzoquinol methylase
MKCRHCKFELTQTFIDLGFAPPSNAYLEKKDLNAHEIYYPLKVRVCNSCWLVQTEDFAKTIDLFNSEYAYFSSTSSSWLKHAKVFVDLICKRLNLTSKSYVIEIAANDGYLLKNFIEKKIPCMGIEPTDNTANAAEKFGIEILRKFFSENLAEDLVAANRQADLIIANNVFAHVPDINDFSRGLKKLLKPQGVVTIEFPHILNLIKFNQFETIYHEHFSYLSLFSAKKILEQTDLRVFDVEEISTHGGSLRIYVCHKESTNQTTLNIDKILSDEKDFGLQSEGAYNNFQKTAEVIKDNFVSFLLEQKRNKKIVVAYGAAAKANTIINFAGIKPDLLPFIFDAAESKQSKFLPGSHIPILKPDIIREIKPKFVIVMPWNIENEIVSELSFIREWGGIFVRYKPEIHLF